jgi:23S rRNA-intervening sequence protein
VSHKHGAQWFGGRPTNCHFDVLRIIKHESSRYGRPAAQVGNICGTQYSEATRAKSNADFISKIEGSLQELEETEYSLELLGEAGFFPKDGLAAVRKETGELKGIFVSIVINTKAKSKPPKSP